MKILVVENMHGDEIGGFAYPNSVDIIIGNPEAKRQKKRYIESDLNRSFNGNSCTFEEKRAKELLPILEKYDFVLDIHSTITGDTNAVISTHNSRKEREAARHLIAKNYIYIPGGRNSLIYHTKNGLSLELGGVHEKSRYQNSIDNFINYLLGKDSMETLLREWECVGVQEKPDGCVSTKTDLKNYESVSTGQVIASVDGSAITASENFTTFLWGDGQYENIFGFKLRAL